MLVEVKEKHRPESAASLTRRTEGASAGPTVSPPTLTPCGSSRQGSTDSGPAGPRGVTPSPGQPAPAILFGVKLEPHSDPRYTARSTSVHRMTRHDKRQRPSAPALASWTLRKPTSPHICLSPLCRSHPVAHRGNARHPSPPGKGCEFLALGKESRTRISAYGSLHPFASRPGRGLAYAPRPVTGRVSAHPRLSWGAFWLPPKRRGAGRALARRPATEEEEVAAFIPELAGRQRSRGDLPKVPAQFVGSPLSACRRQPTRAHIRPWKPNGFPGGPCHQPRANQARQESTTMRQLVTTSHAKSPRKKEKATAVHLLRLWSPSLTLIPALVTWRSRGAITAHSADLARFSGLTIGASTPPLSPAGQSHRRLPRSHRIGAHAGSGRAACEGVKIAAMIREASSDAASGGGAQRPSSSRMALPEVTGDWACRRMSHNKDNESLVPNRSGEGTARGPPTPRDVGLVRHLNTDARPTRALRTNIGAPDATERGAIGGRGVPVESEVVRLGSRVATHALVASICGVAIAPSTSIN
ncbi:hypothetical protein Purlil1_12337 [Purpureocillium lilacinum]|uniref:Uncharacterized protein n=1 Tax=Purpureocillium lilacinum TaxID=33203 RepID=A0ABR0BH70_PURLI|nr:hypothetical protein Purlil1_12337 [Purpureocillium lilacinum]